MKPAVKAKVAHGLVIFLVMPRAADTAMNAVDTYGSLFSFTAEDELDLTVDISPTAEAKVHAEPEDDPSGGDPSGGDPTGGEPSGGLPGGDPSGCIPSEVDPTGAEVIVDAPRSLVTAEDGSVDYFQVSIAPDPAVTRFLRLESTDPGEARPEPGVLVFGEDACLPQTVRVVGQNDGEIDPSGGDPSGGTAFSINVVNEQGWVEDSVPGINLNNDNYPFISVDILGPRSLSIGETTVFTVFAGNTGRAGVTNNDLFIEPSSGLEITGYAASLLSGATANFKVKNVGGKLHFRKLDLAGGETLMVAVEVLLNSGGTSDQKVTARFVKATSGYENDDDHSFRTAVP